MRTSAKNNTVVVVVVVVVEYRFYTHQSKSLRPKVDLPRIHLSLQFRQKNSLWACDVKRLWEKSQTRRRNCTCPEGGKPTRMDSTVSDINETRVGACFLKKPKPIKNLRFFFSFHFPATPFGVFPIYNKEFKKSRRLGMKPFGGKK